MKNGKTTHLVGQLISSPLLMTKNGDPEPINYFTLKNITPSFKLLKNNY